MQILENNGKKSGENYYGKKPIQSNIFNLLNKLNFHLVQQFNCIYRFTDATDAATPYPRRKQFYSNVMLGKQVISFRLCQK